MGVQSPMTPPAGMMGASLMGNHNGSQRDLSGNGNGPPGGYFNSAASLRSQNSNYAQSVHSYGSRGGYQRY